MRPVNDAELLVELDAVTKGYGNTKRVAGEIDMELSHLHSIRSGNRPMNEMVAHYLGYELRWVKKQG
jgi:hypothetical protein